MTPAQRAQLETTAREFVETLLAQDVCLSDVECTLVQQATLALLAAQRAAVLEEAAREIDNVQWWHERVPLEAFQNWLKQQAKKARA